MIDNQTKARDQRIEYLVIALICLNLAVYFGKQLWDGISQ